APLGDDTLAAAVPARDVAVVEVRAAHPAVDAEQLDAIGLPVQDGAPCLRQRQLGSGEAAPVPEPRRRGDGRAVRTRGERALPRAELREQAPGPGVAGERRLLALLARQEQRPGPVRTVAERLEQLPLAARQPRAAVGQLLEQTAESRCE